MQDQLRMIYDVDLRRVAGKVSLKNDFQISTPDFRDN